MKLHNNFDHFKYSLGVNRKNIWEESSLSQVRETIYTSTKSSCLETTANPGGANGMKYSSLAKSILAKLTIKMGEQLLPLPIQFRILLVRKRSFLASNSTPPPPPKGKLARQRFLWQAVKSTYLSVQVLSAISSNLKITINSYLSFQT